MSTLNAPESTGERALGREQAAGGLHPSPQHSSTRAHSTAALLSKGVSPLGAAPLLRYCAWPRPSAGTGLSAFE